LLASIAARLQMGDVAITLWNAICFDARVVCIAAFIVIVLPQVACIEAVACLKVVVDARNRYNVQLRRVRPCFGARSSLFVGRRRLAGPTVKSPNMLPLVGQRSADLWYGPVLQHDQNA